MHDDEVNVDLLDEVGHTGNGGNVDTRNEVVISQDDNGVDTLRATEEMISDETEEDATARRQLSGSTPCLEYATDDDEGQASNHTRGYTRCADDNSPVARRGGANLPADLDGAAALVALRDGAGKGKQRAAGTHEHNVLDTNHWRVQREGGCDVLRGSGTRVDRDCVPLIRQEGTGSGRDILTPGRNVQRTVRRGVKGVMDRRSAALNVL